MSSCLPLEHQQGLPPAWLPPGSLRHLYMQDQRSAHHCSRTWESQDLQQDYLKQKQGVSGTPNKDKGILGKR